MVACASVLKEELMAKVSRLVVLGLLASLLACGSGLDDTKLRVHGRVLGTDGMPARDLRVELSAPAGVVAETLTDAEGAYDLSALRVLIDGTSSVAVFKDDSFAVTAHILVERLQTIEEISMPDLSLWEAVAEVDELDIRWEPATISVDLADITYVGFYGYDGHEYYTSGHTGFFQADPRHLQDFGEPTYFISPVFFRYGSMPVDVIAYPRLTVSVPSVLSIPMSRDAPCMKLDRSPIGEWGVCPVTDGDLFTDGVTDYGRLISDFAIDLGEVRPITAVSFTLVSWEFGQDGTVVDVQVSDDFVNWVPLGSGTWEVDSLGIMELGEPASGRYVRVRFPEQAELRFGEIGVW